MFDLSGTNQDKDPFKLQKQASRRHATWDANNTMAVQTAAISLPLFSLYVDNKKKRKREDPHASMCVTDLHCISAIYPAWFPSCNMAFTDKIILNYGYLIIDAI